MKKFIIMMFITFGLLDISYATTIVGFDFNNGTKTGAITNNATWLTPGYSADYGIAGNINTSKISTPGGPTFDASTWVQGADLLPASSPNTTARNNGSGTKYRVFSFNTLGYGNLAVSSKQQSSPTGPRDFKIQYSTGGSTWFDVGSPIVVDNNFTSGVVNNLLLPTLLNNQSIVFLRWISTSNTGVNGALTAAGGTHRIDNIMILGEQIFTLTYTAGPNGIIVGSGIQSVTSGSNGTTINAIANTGYHFTNRSDGSTINPRTDTAITGNINVTGNFVINQYPVQFKDYDGTVLLSGLVNHGSGAIPPFIPYRTGYIFSGWDQNYAVVTGAMIINAQYTLNQYTLTFDTTGGSIVNTITGDYNTLIIPPTNPTKTGYVFSGWNPTLPSTMPSQNMTFIALRNDNQNPIITLSGAASLTINIGSIYHESGALWTDNVDGSGTNVIISGSVNTSVAGTYIITYSYTDMAGNVGSTTRTVIVADQTSPSISTGSSSINEGNNITINAASLTTDNGPIVQYIFDINNDGTDDFTNTSGILTLTWSQLQSFGISGNNATLLPTDFYTIRLHAKDNSNNIGTGIFQLKVYNIAPVVSITNPIISGKIYTGVLPIGWNITDPADQDFPMNTDIFFSTNGTSYTSLATTTSNRTGSLSWDTTTVSDSTTYTLRVRAIDDYGNNTSTSVPFKIDNHGPSISGQLTYTIAEGDNITFSLTGTTDAVAGVSGFIRTIGSNMTGTSTGLIGLTRAQLQSGGINNDGTYTIGVQSIDNVGNISTKNLTLIITNTAPSLSITNPASGIYSGNISISRTATEPASADLPLNTIISYNNGINSGIIIQGTNLTNPYNRNVASIPDGTGYRITITTSDDDTSTSVSGNIFSIDHTKPTINGFSGNYIINEGSGLTIDLRTTTDAIAGLSGGTAQFIGTINGVNLPNSTNGYRNLSRSNLSTYGITNGSGQSYPITIQVTDAIGNNSTTSGTLTVLNVKPTISITSPSSSLNNVVGTLPIQRTTSDPVDTPLQINLYYASTTNGPRTLLGSGLSSSFTGLAWNTTTVSDGVYYIKATATDDKDTVSTIQGSITINNIPDFVGGGGGGGSSISSDYCPNGDYSSSKYDGNCGTAPSTGVIQPQSGDNLQHFDNSELFNTDIENGYCYSRVGSGTITESSSISTSDEFKKSLGFLYAYNMTMYNNVDQFHPYSQLTREQAAKIFSNFAMNILCRKPDTSLQISYTDTANATPSLKPYITKAYQLGLMKGGKDNTFRPFDTITKAELNAVLIRMILKGYLDETGSVWYTNYNKVSTKLGIITKGATPSPVMRNDASLMMFRAYKNQRFSLQEIDYTSYVLKNRSTYLP